MGTFLGKIPEQVVWVSAARISDSLGSDSLSGTRFPTGIVYAPPPLCTTPCLAAPWVHFLPPSRASSSAVRCRTVRQSRPQKCGSRILRYPSDSGLAPPLAPPNDVDRAPVPRPRTRRFYTGSRLTPPFGHCNLAPLAVNLGPSLREHVCAAPDPPEGQAAAAAAAAVGDSPRAAGRTPSDRSSAPAKSPGGRRHDRREELLHGGSPKDRMADVRTGVSTRMLPYVLYDLQ